MDVDRKEVLRYLGYRGAEADEAVSALMEDCIQELFRASEPKSLSREYGLRLLPDDGVDGGCFQAKSKNLRKNLAGCHGIILFAATLGTGADYLLQRYNKLSVSNAVVMQAAAAAMMEAYCNEVCESLSKEYRERGLFLHPRFSPGYGDFPLSCQPGILDALEAGKRIGIKLTEGFLMLPSKSVTAVIGVGSTPMHCPAEGCEACGKKDCAFRRE